MKKSHLVLALLFLGAALQAQINYLNNNPEWFVDGGYVTGGPCGISYESHHYLKGDTLIDNITYHKLYEEYGWRSSFGPDCPPSNSGFKPETLVGFIRQKDQKLLLRGYQNQEEFLIVDYDLQLGDTVRGMNANTGFPFIVNQIDSVLIYGAYHKTFHDTNNEHREEYFYFEGLGHSGGLLEEYFTNFEASSRLYCYKNNGAYQYGYVDSTSNCKINLGSDEIEPIAIQVYPNPSNGIFNITRNSNQQAQVQVINLSGALVSSDIWNATESMNRIDLSPFPEGVYFLIIKESEQIYQTKLIKF